jgi:hypothetical protein
LHGDTRPVLDDRARDESLAQTHASITVELPKGARLDFGYALEAPTRLASPVAFTVKARQGEKSSTLFASEVKGGSPDANAWHEAVVDLAGLGGDVTLEFATTSAAGEKGAAAYFSDPVISAPAAEAAAPRAVILVSIDALRADHLGIYGYERATSPNLDRTFASGMVVDRFYTNAVDPVAGHASMLTGYLPTTALVPSDAGERIAAEGVDARRAPARRRISARRPSARMRRSPPRASRAASRSSTRQAVAPRTPPSTRAPGKRSSALWHGSRSMRTSRSSCSYTLPRSTRLTRHPRNTRASFRCRPARPRTPPMPRRTIARSATPTRSSAACSPRSRSSACSTVRC